KIDVRLVRAEGGPDSFRSRYGFKLREQWESTWAHRPREIGIARNGEERRLPSRFLSEKLPKPDALRGGMIEDGIEHQFKALPQRLHVTPSAQIRIDGIIIHH